MSGKYKNYTFQDDTISSDDDLFLKHLVQYRIGIDVQMIKLN